MVEEHTCLHITKYRITQYTKHKYECNKTIAKFVHVHFIIKIQCCHTESLQR